MTIPANDRPQEFGLLLDKDLTEIVLTALNLATYVREFNADMGEGRNNLAAFDGIVREDQHLQQLLNHVGIVQYNAWRREVSRAAAARFGFIISHDYLTPAGGCKHCHCEVEEDRTCCFCGAAF